jgi:hypothetical protein
MSGKQGMKDNPVNFYELTSISESANINFGINEFYLSIQMNNRIETGAREGLIGKSVKCRCGPATVIGSESKKCHWRF